MGDNEDSNTSSKDSAAETADQSEALDQTTLVEDCAVYEVPDDVKAEAAAADPVYQDPDECVSTAPPSQVSDNKATGDNPRESTAGVQLTSSLIFIFAECDFCW